MQVKLQVQRRIQKKYRKENSMYNLGEISNRDISLLHQFRILRQPADLLSSVFNSGEPILTSIKEGMLGDLVTDDGRPMYAFDMQVNIPDDKIPYLEFDCASDIDRKRLESLICLDNSLLYGVRSDFDDEVFIKIYLVDSLDAIRQAINQYRDMLDELSIEGLRKELEAAQSKPKGLPTVEGRDNNLVEFSQASGRLHIKDSDYMITSALDAQMLVNPSQELLMSLPRKLKHSINISVTDGRTRYLDLFSGYTINIKGKGNWVLRDVTSTINFTTGTGFVYAWNCSLIHFRTTIDFDVIRGLYHCTKLTAHRSLIVSNQFELDDAVITGGTTLMLFPFNIASPETLVVHKISYVGCGCHLYSGHGAVPVISTNVLGMVWWFNLLDRDTQIYIGGRRIDEVSSEHDAEMKPSQIVETNVGNIKIYQGGEEA